MTAAAPVPALTQAAPAPARRLIGQLIGGALLGKILGFLREIAMAHALGISFIADGFRSSITAVFLPLLPLQGDTVPAVLIPLHKQWREEGVAAERFACLSAVIFLTASALMLGVMLLSHAWLHLLVGGFTPEAFALTERFVQVMALAMPASAVFGCLCSVELSLGRSRLMSMRASIQNFGVMTGLAIMALTGRAIAIPWCFTLAFNMIAVWGGVTLWREGHLSVRGINPASMADTAAQFLRRLRPLLVQPLADFGQTWLERLLASASGAGTVASLDYARSLTESALFMVSQPVGYAVLAQGHVTASAAARRMGVIARPTLALALPASIFLIFGAHDIVRLIFARGAFDAEAVDKTSLALQGIAGGLWAATLGWILIRMLNAGGRNAAAAAVLVAAYAANGIIDLALVRPLGPLGLGLGEAGRGIVLLLGTAVALQCLPALLRLLIIAAPVSAVLVIAEMAANTHFAAPWPRLGAELAACLLAIMIQAATLMPAFLRTCRAWTGRTIAMIRPLPRP